MSAPTNIALPTEHRVPGGRDGLVSWAFRGLRKHIGDGRWLAGRAILAPRNQTVRDINETVLDSVDADAWRLLSADSLAIDETTPIPIEYLNSIEEGGLPPHELKLKRGVPIMLSRNLNPREGLCNLRHPAHRRRRRCSEGGRAVRGAVQEVGQEEGGDTCVARRSCCRHRRPSHPCSA